MKRRKVTTAFFTVLLTFSSLSQTTVLGEDFFSSGNIISENVVEAGEENDAAPEKIIGDEEEGSNEELGFSDGIGESPDEWDDQKEETDNTEVFSVEENSFENQEESFCMDEEEETDSLILAENAYGTAKSISVNTVYSSSFPSATSELWLKFTLSKPGSISLSFQHDDMDSSLTYWSADFYEENGSDRLAGYIFQGNQKSYVKKRFGVKSGTYYLKIDSVNYSDTKFRFKINYTETEVWEKEQNNKYSDASTVKIGTAYSGSLQMQSDEDWYRFTVSTVGNYSFLFEHEFIESSGNYWKAHIYDSALKEKAVYSYQGNEKSTQNKFIIGKTGTYYVKIEKANYSDGIYSFKVAPNWKTTAYGNVPIDALYYNGHYYYVYDLKSSWSEAKTFCNALGGYMATITSKNENDTVFQYMKNQGYDSAYFGLTSDSTGKKWNWVNGETVSYTNWAPGEPNSSRECYGMFYYKYSSGTWNDGDFGNSTVGKDKSFICEWGPYTVHTHSYQCTVTPATFSSDGTAIWKCSCGAEKSRSTIYRVNKVAFSKPYYTYSGKAQKPVFQLYDSKGNVISASYYTATYEKNPKNVGTHKVYLRFNGNYKGTGTVSYVINPKGTSIKSLTRYSKAFRAKWGKVTNCSGYQIQCSTSKKFQSSKTSTVSSKSKTSFTVKYLQGNKRYYVRVRSYKVVSGVKYWSAWSKIKSVRTKK